MLLAIIVWLSIIGIAFLVFGLLVKLGLTKEIRELKEEKNQGNLMQHRLAIMKDSKDLNIMPNDIVEVGINAFSKKNVEEDSDTNGLISSINIEDILQVLHSEDRDEPFSYETILDDVGYVPRMFLAGRGSWRASQGNIYTLSMLTKEISHEFNKRL